ncbi:dTDP-4-dehydrorhamnose reductase [Haloarcula sp. CBA1127]|uniref:dTDP-4-dehydrorhamnose reductase n=1 Tax=Haloarcula sp. CBA1127 TaxID=1765055 RepID=UPI0009ABB823|nr:dTDP-4-dehydrorhamnose reductase [Haloarcula sp. CBA1127]
MNIVVIGGSGLVGQNILRSCEERGISATGTYRTAPDTGTNRELDKTDPVSVRELLQEIEPDAVVDTAAFHAVDDCESEQERAWTVNAQGTKHVASAADAVGAQLIYLSTDYVYSGAPSDAPFSETDSVSPVNYYARTKYAGEQAAKIATETTVLRPSVIYGLASSNFVTWAISELRAGNEISIVDDQVSTPTYARDLAQAALAVADQNLTGVYNAAGPTRMSRYRFTRDLAASFGFNQDLISPISTEEFGQEAPRPTDSSLDSSRISNNADISFRSHSAVFDKLAEISQ